MKKTLVFLGIAIACFSTGFIYASQFGNGDGGGDGASPNYAYGKSLEVTEIRAVEIDGVISIPLLSELGLDIFEIQGQYRGGDLVGIKYSCEWFSFARCDQNLVRIDMPQHGN